MKRSILVFAIVAVCSSLVPAAQYSKLSLVNAAKAIGKWGDIKSFIASAGLTDEWQCCAYISDSHPLFSLATNHVVTVGIVTAEEMAQILSASVDSAVSDELLRRVYAADMETIDGRKRWHGNVVETVFDTNKLEKVQTHEDGYVHRSPFARLTPGTIENQLSAAERKAKAEAERQERKRIAEARRQERIAELTTNMAYHAAALMRTRRWPEDLARLYLTHELNTLVGTNTISVTITPEG